MERGLVMEGGRDSETKSARDREREREVERYQVRDRYSAIERASQICIGRIGIQQIGIHQIDIRPSAIQQYSIHPYGIRRIGTMLERHSAIRHLGNGVR